MLFTDLSPRHKTASAHNYVRIQFTCRQMESPPLLNSFQNPNMILGSGYTFHLPSPSWFSWGYKKQSRHDSFIIPSCLQSQAVSCLQSLSMHTVWRLHGARVDCRQPRMTVSSSFLSDSNGDKGGRRFRLASQASVLTMTTTSSIWKPQFAVCL